MELLGESQTFIGVLATIVVLCVITDSSNFIYNIFKSIIEETGKEIEDFKNHMSELSDKLRQSEEFVKFNAEIKRIEQLSITTYNSSRALNRKIEFEISINKYTNEYSSTYFHPISTKFDEIKKSREQTFGPLYTFAFCLLLFLCDEICRWKPLYGDAIVGMLSFFMAVSTIFILFIWGKFWRECTPNKKRDKEATSSTNVNVNKQAKEKIYECIKQVFICIFGFCIAPIVLLQTIFPNLPHVVLWCLSVFLSLSLFVVKGYKHQLISPHCGQYKHSFLLLHFIVIAVFALAFSIISVLSNIQISYEHLYTLRIGCICFIILNGIVFPFVFPYYANNKVRKFAKKWSGNGEDEALRKGEKLKLDLIKALQEINSELEREKEEKLEFKLLGTDCDIESMRGQIRMI